MDNQEYLDMLVKLALKPEPNDQSVRALDEVIAIVGEAIKALEGKNTGKLEI